MGADIGTTQHSMAQPGAAGRGHRDEHNQGKPQHQNDHSTEVACNLLQHSIYTVYHEVNAKVRQHSTSEGKSLLL